ncbi:transcription termination factor MTERF5, chloroplastic-like [Macadamia integrifolia]|uniref:transcription termination factor MTERF5, chloroplastic-like n=1 Tax=Macadamia integrifolia TaxID=60698 RepID=UPI001C4EBEC6|nr:transcription termination factor MTERF5, chloroplastic-like [Macadamia integrifolia]
MFSFLFKRVPIGRTVRDSTTKLGFLQNPSSSLIFISSKASRNQNRFVVSYLISSCGLSPAAAISASKKVWFESSDRPDSVLTLFRNHGFTDTQISRLIGKCPSLLLSNPTETLLPKLEFFHSLGVSSPNLARFICKDPKVLFSSLENKIIPTFDFLKSLLGTLENIIGLNNHSRLIGCDIQNVGRNIAILREYGVPESNIVRILTYYPITVTPKNDLFKQRVEEIKKMGFNLSKYMFMRVLYVFTSLTKSTWKLKMEAYGRCGFSENEILMAFRRYPCFMEMSEKRIMSHMDFLVNKMGCERAVIITYPQLFGFSLEKRILPRYSVFRVLLLKGLVKEDRQMVHMLIESEKLFLEKFVTKYDTEVPQLLDVYKGNISLLELGYGTDQVWKEPIVKCPNFEI